MASDIKVVVDSSDLQLLKRELVDIPKKAKDSASVFEREFKKVETRLNNAAKNSQQYYNQLLKVEKSQKSAAQSASVFEASIKKNTQALNSMRASYDANYAVEQRTLQLKKLLRQEIANGTMTVRQAGAELLKYRKHMQQFNVAQMAATKSSNRMGVVTQQAGYQVSDFIVQVQSGTNPFVAFSQQASQLAGVLPLVAGRLGITTAAAIGLSAALGIVIPLVGAIGAAFYASSKAASESAGSLDTFASSMSEAEKYLDDFVAASERLVDEDLETVYGNMADKVRSLTAAFRGLKLELSQEALGSSADKLLEKFNADAETGRTRLEQLKSSFADALNMVAFFGPIRVPQGLGADAVRDQTDQLRTDGSDALKRIGLKATPLDISDIQYNVNVGNYERANELIEKLAENQTELTTEGKKFLLNLEEVAKRGLQLKGEMNGTAEAARESTRESKRLSSEQREAARLAERRTAFEKDVAVNLGLSATLYGKTRDQQKQLTEESKFHVKLLELGYKPTDGIYQNLVKSYKETVQNTQAAEEFADKLEQAALAGERLANFESNLDIELAKANAELDALKSGQDASSASFMAAEKLKAEAAYETAKALYLQTNNIEGLAEASIQYAEILAKLDLLEKKRADIRTTKESLKKDNRQTGKEYVDNLLKEARHRQKISKLTEEQARYQDLLYKMEEQNAKKKDPLHQKTLEQKAKEIHQINEQTKAIEAQKALQEEVSSAIENRLMDGFQSMVDGTKSVKDAFKDMAALIIQDLYRILVLKKLVASISALLPFENGGVISGGNVVPFAKGGVVGAPTFFPMNGNKTGLMGEAGPEAIMPLKRGPDGKLGVSSDGGGKVSVVNNITVQGNANPAQVRAEVVKLMPTITSVTRDSIAQANRRGK